MGPQRRTPSRHRGRDGFLLAEALVTMAIGAFLLVAMVSLLHLAVRADARTQDLASRVEAQTRALEAIGRDLRPALRVRWSGPDAPFVFAGGPDTMWFAGRDETSGEVRLVTLHAEPGRVLRTSAALPSIATSPDDLAGGSRSEIETGGDLVRFSYFQALPDGEDVLLDTWTSPLAMPSAVRIAILDIRTGEPRASLRIPLMIDAEPGCAAPSRAACSYREAGDADVVAPTDLPPEAVDAADPLGWARYAR
ncbi:type II secretion system protein J [Aureimonas sp. AU4]|uniref:PulJ/GspJ family protein n=1 Tax=Aureimonas sp. AU4 TaxID=1638163 RepID=UPI00070672A7|nr:hypothetical protein [Aureimonas sp. AU4]BAT30573.1 hypothetical protein [Aureimonas sp. AU4]